MRSFTDPPGFMNSHLPSSSPGKSLPIRDRRTIGVWPVASRIESRISERAVMRPAVYDEWVPRVARVTAVLGASVIAVAASCFSKPGEPHAHLGDDGGPHDGLGDSPGSGSNIDANLTNCGVHDDFNTQDPPCGLWGTPGNPNYMQRFNGVLQMTPTLLGGSASCTTTQPFKFGNGTSIEIPMPLLASMGDHSWFKVSPMSSTTDYTMVNIYQAGSGGGAQVQVTCTGTSSAISETYNALAHRYWRFTPQNGGDDVKIESGQNAATATAFAGLSDCNWLPSSVTMVTVSFGVGAGMAANNTGTFDNFNTNPCPPP
jgi:hypothetical protein